MKITRKELFFLIEGYLSQDVDVAADMVYQSGTKQAKSIYLCARPLGLGYGHAYILIKNQDGTETSYSGKSGIPFSFPNFIKRITVGRTTPGADRKSKYSKAHAEKTDWGVLRKIINWSSDEWEDQSEFNVITDINQESPEQVQDAAIALESAFNNYEENIPYDPVAGHNISYGYDAPKNARNSNSFAFTILKNIASDAQIDQLKNQIKLKLPGWGMNVIGLRA